MDRFSFRVTEENRRRLEILKAFAVLGGKDPTYRDLVNESIERFFVEAYDIYCKQVPESDYLEEIMEKVLPGKVA